VREEEWRKIRRVITRFIERIHWPENSKTFIIHPEAARLKNDGIPDVRHPGFDGGSVVAAVRLEAQPLFTSTNLRHRQRLSRGVREWMNQQASAV